MHTFAWIGIHIEMGQNNSKTPNTIEEGLIVILSLIILYFQEMIGYVFSKNYSTKDVYVTKYFIVLKKNSITILENIGLFSYIR